MLETCWWAQAHEFRLLCFPPMWQVIDMDQEVHVVPIGDLWEHDPECLCGPRCEIEAGSKMLFIHNSLDGRERYET